MLLPNQSVPTPREGRLPPEYFSSADHPSSADVNVASLAESLASSVQENVEEHEDEAAVAVIDAATLTKRCRSLTSTTDTEATESRHLTISSSTAPKKKTTMTTTSSACLKSTKSSAKRSQISNNLRRN